jgi:hypothetical protein
MIGGIGRQADGIAGERVRRLPTQRKTQRGKLALLVATMLHARSANLMALAASLPLATESEAAAMPHNGHRMPAVWHDARIVRIPGVAGGARQGHRPKDGARSALVQPTPPHNALAQVGRCMFLFRS